MGARWTTKAPSRHERAESMSSLLTAFRPTKPTLEPVHLGGDPRTTDRAYTGLVPEAMSTTYTGRATPVGTDAYIGLS